jgi:preprotein translocase subunit SecE
MMIGRLERLLAELEGQKFCSEICRGKYDLMASIIARLQSVCSDLQKYLLEDFQKVSMEDIAKTIWSKKTTLKTGTLSVLSDDSFISAFDEFVIVASFELF